ncbi:MAG: sensor histidine kinase [Methanosarcina sp.]
MVRIIKKKEQINATVSPWIKKRCLELAGTSEFSSVSDVVSLALSEFLGKYDYLKTKELKERENRVTDLLEALMKTKEGQKWLQSVYRLDDKKSSCLDNKSFQSLEQYFESLILFRVDENFTLCYINGDLESLTGYSKEDFLINKIRWIEIVLPEDRPLVYESLKKVISGSDTSAEVEYRIWRKDGEIRWIQEILQKPSTRSKILGKAHCLVHDITKKKAMDFTLKKAQEARIKEIHHRIKNNLQVISSLLSLEAERSTDAKTLEAFRESQNRVASMALIHQELYSGEELDALDFADYLQKLTSDLFHSYKLGNEEINLKFNLETLYLDMNTAIPLGIIVNELVSNALKYAFPPGSKGEIYICLAKTESCLKKCGSFEIQNIEQGYINEKDYLFTLIVADNGKGFPQEVDPWNMDSLGLQIVNILVEQIGGSITLNRDNGTSFIIYFNVSG